MALPLRLPPEQRDTQWKSQIDPLLSNVLNSVHILKNVSLINGTTIIDHKLGYPMVGWMILDQTAAASIYRPVTSPFNSKTLTLISSAAVVVNLGVF